MKEGAVGNAKVGKVESNVPLKGILRHTRVNSMAKSINFRLNVYLTLTVVLRGEKKKVFYLFK